MLQHTAEKRSRERPTQALLKTAEEIERRCGVSRYWLYRAAKRGEIPHYRVGVGVRFIEDELLAALKAGV